MTSASAFSIAHNALRGGSIVARSIVAGAAFLAAGSIATAPAFAQDAKVQSVSYEGVGLNTDCKTWHVGQFGGAVLCQIYKNKILDNQSAALDKELASKNKGLAAKNEELAAKNKELASKENVTSCLQKIKSALDQGLTTREQLGAISKANACAVAAQLG